jgi:hypothetical protein
MNALLPPVLASYLQPKPCTMFVLACGALVREKQAFSDLQKLVRRYESILLLNINS